MVKKESHWSKIESSPRLQRVFALMKDWQCRSTREIERGADVSAAGEAMTELRRNFERKDLPKDYAGYILPPSKQKRSLEGRLVATYQFFLENKTVSVKTKATVPLGQMDFLRTNIGGMAVVK